MTSVGLRDELRSHGQQVLVLQGGGALGAYQVGVYQALHEAGIEPDWVIGTSIGAINAAIIAGSPADERMDRLTEFWRRVEHGHSFERALPPAMASFWRNASMVWGGHPAFFMPNPMAFASVQSRLGPEKAAYYSVDRLRETLSDLIDFDRIDGGEVRLTVGASRVTTSEMVYFDSREMPLDLRHVMASGALPPAFPAVRIDGELYWDGGILSNTPVEVVFDDNPRRDSMVYAVHIWNSEGPEPESIWEVMNRQKDVQYSSRSASHIKRQRQLHKLRHVISELSAMLPADVRAMKETAALSAYGCPTRMHVIRLLAPVLDYEDHSKDIDFSPGGIRARWDAGYADTIRTLEAAPWRAEADPLEGFILHEARGGQMVDPVECG
ncbi:patatin-like phospholipase family protein [Erythrobacter mangrovi]|uniref:Patatin-like phospholipase family protein n=1 Tax=Erythrobacter mangrovi TaxID=2739433 RepID=A0A7D3XSL6_9SPHN|nr:patatin-like phospholipase family protein [Erythrobacter mangrovi]QKG72574.1 patatin-like phospholipase family protein [Erythrobacter mangrovi]